MPGSFFSFFFLGMQWWYVGCTQVADRLGLSFPSFQGFPSIRGNNDVIFPLLIGVFFERATIRRLPCPARPRRSRCPDVHTVQNVWGLTTYVGSRLPKLSGPLGFRFRLQHNTLFSVVCTAYLISEPIRNHRAQVISHATCVHKDVHNIMNRIADNVSSEPPMYHPYLCFFFAFDLCITSTELSASMEFWIRKFLTRSTQSHVRR